MAPLNVVIVGCTQLARVIIPVVEEVAMLAGVVNLHPEASFGKSNYDYLADFANRRKENLHWTKDVNSEETVAWIAARHPDILLQLGWSEIFGRHLLEVPRLFAVGVHPSPLPVGRGAAVINWKIIEGGGSWGNSLFIMEDRTDSGDILDFEPFEIEPREDVRTAHDKVNRTAVKMIRRTLPRLATGNFDRLPQDEDRVTRYPRRHPEDGELLTSWGAEQFLNHVRALTHPYPGAFLRLVDEKVFIWQATKGPVTKKHGPGTILRINAGKGVLLKVGGEESVLLQRVSTVSEPEAWADEWAFEADLLEGCVLTSAKR